MPYADAIEYTTHGAKRRIESGYSEEDVRQALRDGWVIEKYPDTGRGESYLLLHWTTPAGRPVHVVAADKTGEPPYTLIVTVYDPRTEPEEWTDGYATRRR